MAKAKKTQAPKLSMHAIYLRGSRILLADSFDPTLPGQQLEGKYKVSGDKVACRELTLGQGVIRSCLFTTNFEFRYFRASTGEKTATDQETLDPVVEVSAQFAADYMVEAPETPPEEELQVWARTGVMLHCWPYWREYCQSTLSRMHLPIATMPLMIVAPPNP